MREVQLPNASDPPVLGADSPYAVSSSDDGANTVARNAERMELLTLDEPPIEQNPEPPRRHSLPPEMMPLPVRTSFSTSSLSPELESSRTVNHSIDPAIADATIRALQESAATSTSSRLSSEQLFDIEMEDMTIPMSRQPVRRRTATEQDAILNLHSGFMPSIAQPTLEKQLVWLPRLPDIGDLGKQAMLLVTESGVPSTRVMGAASDVESPEGHCCSMDSATIYKTTSETPRQTVPCPEAPALASSLPGPRQATRKNREHSTVTDRSPPQSPSYQHGSNRSHIHSSAVRGKTSSVEEPTLKSELQHVEAEYHRLHGEQELGMGDYHEGSLTSTSPTPSSRTNSSSVYEFHVRRISSQERIVPTDSPEAVGTDGRPSMTPEAVPAGAREATDAGDPLIPSAREQSASGNTEPQVLEDEIPDFDHQVSMISRLPPNHITDPVSPPQDANLVHQCQKPWCLGLLDPDAVPTTLLAAAETLLPASRSSTPSSSRAIGTQSPPVMASTQQERISEQPTPLPTARVPRFSSDVYASTLPLPSGIDFSGDRHGRGYGYDGNVISSTPSGTPPDVRTEN
ncbi:hypothetical protein M011DRAFT_477237 [Sporormia fimetaria CBS 119925]|uniref:Uncharacterized protein n=1 Tax=Sporormia fimetaria CBS 119925 TaxID=1340428 RepID=A0A6A6VET8_9PLEO|nr:hypothetical protein M011DRAFT_477237 [Sporormia fimetaria CBS 119925]